MFHYEFVITEKCNWNCEYCQFPDIAHPQDMQFDRIKHHFDYIKPLLDKFASSVNITGGEPAFVGPIELHRLLEMIDKKVSIDTNGLLFRYGLLNDYQIRQYIEKVYWHVSKNCNGPTSLLRYTDNEIEIIPGIVCTDYIRMNEFIHNNKHIDFKYIAKETPFYEESKVNKDIIHNCRDFNNFITIDLVNERILLCIRNHNICWIPLNEENFKAVHTRYPCQMFHGDKSCYNCSRLCIDRSKNIDIGCRIRARQYAL